MPPHCDSMDGPVVTAARKAFEAADVSIALAYVPKRDEDEVRHRAGEGAAYTGLKPAGLDHGPVIPVAEHAIDVGSPDRVVELLTARVEEEVRERFDRVMELKARADGDLDANRAYVAAMLDLQVWSHGLYQATSAEAHAHQRLHAD